MKPKTTFLFLMILSAFALAPANAQETKSESGMMAVKSVIYSATSIGGAGAYASSEYALCDFSLVPADPNCSNSIFGLLQMEASLQGLENSRKLAIFLLDEGNPNLKIDLKNEGFCISPAVDSCIQDAVDSAVVSIYPALKDGTNASYAAAIENLQTQIDGKLAEFTAMGYIIDKAAKKVTPPLGAPQEFSGDDTVANTPFERSKEKFQSALDRTDTYIEEAQALSASLLLDVAAALVASGVISGGSAPNTVVVPPAPEEPFSSKTSASKSPGQLFFAELSDVQKGVSLIAPQGEEVFGSVSSRYKKMQKSGDFIQP